MIKKTTLEQRINCLELAFKLKNEAAVPAGVDQNSDPAGRRAMSAAVGEKKVNHDAGFVDLLVEYGSTMPQVW